MDQFNTAAADFEPGSSIDNQATEALAELAEAEADEAEAHAQLARARAKAARLRSTVAKMPNGYSASALAPDGSEVQEPALTDEHSDATEPEPEPETDTVDANDHVQPGQPAKSVRLWRRRPRWARLALVAAVLATCGFVTATAVMVWQHRKVEAQHVHDTAIVAAARHDVEMLLSIDYSKVREDVQRIIGSSTGKFRDDFAKNAKEFVEDAEKAKAVSQVTISAAALQSVSGDSATVLVSVASRVTNANGANQDQRPWRMRVTMDRDGSDLKMSNVEFVP